MKYRAEIDGLRGVSVLAVILYHTNLNILPGGFLGVDVFFVISGYLISTLIHKDIKNNNFNLIYFFERRIRRIAPAFFFVIFFTYIIGIFLLLPNNLNDFLINIISSSLFLSNFSLYFQQNYFDQSSLFNPLIHTWSLSIEEQYYLFFPLIMIFFKNKIKFLIIFLIFCILFSFFISQINIQKNTYTDFDIILNFNYTSQSSFYFTFSRIWEILLGCLAGICIQYFNYTNRYQFINEIIIFISFLAICFSFIFLSKDYPTPGIYTLIPIVGTLLILIVRESKILNLLKNNYLVGIGLISYSLYLWHQPIFAYYRIYDFNNLDLKDYILAITITFIISFFTWKFVESPFRTANKFKSKNIFILFFLFIILTNIITFIFYNNDNLKNYIFSEKDLKLIKTIEMNPKKLEKAYRQECNFYNDPRLYPLHNVMKNNINENCYKNPDNKKTIFIWGDSHAQAIGAGINDFEQEEYFIAQIASSSCPPRLEKLINEPNWCSKSNLFAKEIIKKSIPEIVILAQQKNHEQTNWLKIATELKKYGVQKIILIGPTPQYIYSLPLIKIYKKNDQLSKYYKKSIFNTDKVLLNKYIKSKELKYISLIKKLCSNEECIYKFSDLDDTSFLLKDDGHLTPNGSKFIAMDFLFDEIIK